MRACFICGADWVCGHREPELLEYHARLQERLLSNAAALQMQLTPRKPPAIEPSGSNARAAK